MPTLSVLSSDVAVDALTDIRRQILESLDEPGSATTIAQRLGTTRQRVNYHIKALEEMNLIELEEVRQRRGLEERVMRRTADVVIVSPTVFSDVALSAKDSAGVSGVVTTASDIIRHVAVVANEASRRDESLATATIESKVTLASPTDLRRLVEDIGEVIASYDSEKGVEFRVAAFALPTEEESR